MNRIKQDYPFVDLLKPETAASIPILLALAPGARVHARTILELKREAKKHAPGSDSEPRFADDIAAAGSAFNEELWRPEGSSELDALPTFGADLAAGRGALDALLDTLMPGRGTAFLDTVRRASQAEPSHEVEADLDWRNLLRLAIRRPTSPLHKRLEILQDALQVLRRDISWNRARESREYMTSIEKRFQAGFRCVVYGHTHLAKRVERDGCVYLNTGTWADLMRVPQVAIERTDEGRAALAKFCASLEASELDQIIEWVPTFACVTLDDNEKMVSAELCDWPSLI